MLEKISMIIFMVLQILFLILCVSTYFFIKGASEVKTDEERGLEDEEQMKYLKKLEEKKSENK